MAILAKNTSAPRELIPAGNYVARCYSMIEIGTVTETIQGQSKQLHKVRIGWEFPNDQKVYSQEKGEQPMTFSEEYTLSMNEKANLRKMLASWRGKDFTQDEAKAFDITSLIGKPCMMNIIHRPKATDPSIIYANIGSVSNIPKGLQVPPQINPTFILSYDDFSIEKFNSLPDFIKDKMKLSVEFQAVSKILTNLAAKDAIPAPTRTATGDVVKSQQPVTVGDEDDLPF